MNIELFIAATLFVIGNCSDAAIYDCSAVNRDNVRLVDITETYPVDSVLLMFNNSYGPLGWKSSANGTNGGYLSLFFKSSPVEGANHTHALKLAKILDLELLQMELESSEELFSENDATMLTLDLSVFCNARFDKGIEWKFKINIHAVNEFYPQFIGSPFKTKISESTTVGTQIFDIGSKANDLDAGQTNLTFAIAPYMITQFDGRGYVTMENIEKGIIVLAKSLDFEFFLDTGRTYMFVNITAADNGGFTSATSVNITVTDSNDQGIQLVYPNCTRPCLAANYTVTTNESFIGQLDAEPVAILVEDLDTLNDRIIYTLASDSDKEFFDIDESTGTLYKTAPLVNDSYGFSIPLQVTAQEVSDEDHYIDFNVTILVSERLPKPRPNVRSAGATGVGALLF